MLSANLRGSFEKLIETLTLRSVISGVAFSVVGENEEEDEGKDWIEEGGKREGERRGA